MSDTVIGTEAPHTGHVALVPWKLLRDPAPEVPGDTLLKVMVWLLSDMCPPYYMSTDVIVHKRLSHLKER